MVEKPTVFNSGISNATFRGKYETNFDGLKPSTLYKVKITTFRGDQQAAANEIEFRSDRPVPPRNLEVIESETTKVSFQFDRAPNAESYQYEVVHISDDLTNTRRKGVKIYNKKLLNSALSH